MKIFPVIVIGVVAVAVVAGFFVVGSPATERVRRFDERRVSDLQSLQWEIINYWQKKNELPSALDALRDDVRGFSAPADPATGTAYGYAIEAPSAGPVFSLCADFAMENRGAGDPVYRQDNWEHPAGNFCFRRTVDKDLYPPVPMKPVPVIQYNN
jgi:hypothetical protein